MSDPSGEGSLFSSRVLTFLLRYRSFVLGALAIVNGIADGAARIYITSDFAYFNAAGTALLTGDWDHVFSDPLVQVGPLTLGVAGAFTALAEVSGLSRGFLFAIGMNVFVTFAAVWLTRFVYRDRGADPHPALELGVGLMVIAGALPFITVVSGHPTETVIPLLWVLAARAAMDERGTRAGLWIGVAAAFKLWGILGLPLLFLARTWRQRLLAAAVATAGLVVTYGPFFASGGAGTFAYEWRVMSWAPVAPFIEAGTPFTWEMRVVQGALVIAVGIGATLFLRVRPMALWTVPLALVLLRLVTDPLLFNYYWLAPELIGLAGMALLFERLSVSARVAVVAGFFVIVYAVFLSPVPATIIRFVLFTALIVVAVRSGVRERNQARPLVVTGGPPV